MMGQTIHHGAVNKDYCPIKALARILHHLLSNGPTDDPLLCDSFDGKIFNSINPDKIIHFENSSKKSQPTSQRD